MDARLSALPANHTEAGIKRLLDVLIAGAGLVLFLPLFLVILLLIRLETPGRGLYRQERVGWGGRRFLMLKFRTMQDCADQALESYLAADLGSRAEYEKYQKLHQDPRLTGVGRFLRRTSLDELPQLWNVLVGEMSLVGPRPFLPKQLGLYGPGYRYYQTTRPGLTGLWQVSGRNRLSFQERVRLDEKYVREWSLWLDLRILLRTPWAVFFQGGAY